MQITETELYIKDKNGRLIFKIVKDKVMVSRYPNMSPVIKEELTRLYVEFTKEKKEKIIKFLNFESDDVEFCS